MHRNNKNAAVENLEDEEQIYANYKRFLKA